MKGVGVAATPATATVAGTRLLIDDSRAMHVSPTPPTLRHAVDGADARDDDRTHAPATLAFDLRNDGDWPVSCTVEVLAANGERGDPAPAAGAVHDRWTWSYWVEAGDRRVERGPDHGTGASYVRVVADDGRVAGTWATADEVVHVAVTEDVLAATPVE